MRCNPKINRLVNIAIASGSEVIEFETSGGICYLIKLNQSDNIYKLCIPDEIEMIDFETWRGIIDDSILEVIGGAGLKSTAEMFRNVECKELNLSSFDTSNVTDMSGMFYNCKVGSLDLSGFFNTSNVVDMSSMFRNIDIDYIDLSNFNTSNVISMYRMFEGINIENLDLSSFDTSNVVDMYQMFEGVNITNLDLSSFDTSNVEDMYRMFGNVNIANLNLSNFNTSNVTDMSRIFG